MKEINILENQLDQYSKCLSIVCHVLLFYSFNGTIRTRRNIYLSQHLTSIMRNSFRNVFDVKINR